jgi:hypothetical protein
VPKVRVHWTLPERQIQEIARRAEIADRSEPYIVERMIDFAIAQGFDLTSGQAREFAEALRVVR